MNGRGFVGLIASAVLLLAACSGRAGLPPKPERSIVPEIVALADHWEFINAPCTEYRFTLTGGRTIDIVLPATAQPGCEAHAATVELIANSRYGTSGTDPGVRWGEGFSSSWAPLIMAGNVDGKPWWAAVRGSDRSHGPAQTDCYLVRLEKGEGAWHEGRTLHLTSGLIVPLAASFRYPTYPQDPFPLRVGDGLCLNARGEATSVDIWIPY